MNLGSDLESLKGHWLQKITIVLALDNTSTGFLYQPLGCIGLSVIAPNMDCTMNNTT